jgi:carboxynorspermidine decarboxylase
MGGETHVFSAAYRVDEFDQLLDICDHVVFNSFNEWQRYREKAVATMRKPESQTKFGIRINPEFSTQSRAITDPCVQGSRLGATSGSFRPDLLDGLSGFHFHTLSEQGSDALAATIEAVEDKFGRYLFNMEWLNLGGGHYITKKDYDIATLVSCVTHLKEKYGLEIYLEPGEAIALDAGFLVTSVLDIVENANTRTAILDASAACHLNEVLEMDYMPTFLGAGKPNEKAYTYTLGGPTCLAGDLFGEYSFDHVLEVGNRLVIKDMATYTMVKNNTFNGMRLPTIAVARKGGQIETVREFGYNDFRSRLS